MNIKNSDIILNYEKYDDFLEIVKNGRDKAVYDIFFSIRSVYCSESVRFIRRNGRIGVKYCIKKSLKTFAKILSLAFLRRKINVRSGFSFLFSTKHDSIAADMVGLPVVKPRQEIRISKSFFSELFLIMRASWIFLSDRNLDSKLKLYSFSGVAEFLLGYSSLSVSGVPKILVTENDLDPFYVGVLIRAKELGIKTVKIEYYFLDDVNHNNVLCDYYFYPNEFTKEIRLSCKYNKDLIYIEGGYLGFDKLIEVKPIAESASIVCFYGQYAYPEIDKEGLFLLADTLSEQIKIVIFPHPNDPVAPSVRYRAFSEKSSRFEIHTDNSSKYSLIAKSLAGFSVFSSLSLETIVLGIPSFFLNTGARDSEFISYYKNLKNVIQVIETKGELLLAITGIISGTSQISPVNKISLTFPNTRKHLLNLLDSLGA